MADVSLEMIQSLVARSLEEQATLRKDNANLLSLMLGLVDQVRRLDRRVADVDRRVAEVDRRVLEARDDIDLMFRAELVGQLGNFEARIDQRLADFAEHPPASAL